MANYKVTIEAQFENGNAVHDVLSFDNKDNAYVVFNNYIAMINNNAVNIKSAYLMLFNCKTRNEMARYTL